MCWSKMKKDWMNKLIKLLNEYEKERWTNRVCYWADIWVVMSGWITYRFSYVISKEYWFIKRLVDNDKIVLEKVKNIKLPIDTKLRARVDEDEKTCFNRLYTLKLLMLCSIQDNPIEFLISVLK